MCRFLRAFIWLCMNVSLCVHHVNACMFVRACMLLLVWSCALCAGIQIILCVVYLWFSVTMSWESNTYETQKKFNRSYLWPITCLSNYMMSKTHPADTGKEFTPNIQYGIQINPHKFLNIYIHIRYKYANASNYIAQYYTLCRIKMLCWVRARSVFSFT